MNETCLDEFRCDTRSGGVSISGSIINHIVTALIVISLAGCNSPDTSPAVSGLNWNLEIDQPIRQLEDILETLEQQQSRNYTISNISFLYEVKLFHVFQEYVESLPFDERSRAIREQSEWMKDHRRLVAEAYAEYEGGTLAGYNAGVMSIELLRERLDTFPQQ